MVAIAYSYKSFHAEPKIANNTTKNSTLDQEQSGKHKDAITDM